MLEKTLIISFFTLIIHMSETLSYSIRLAGVRINRLAVALSLTGIVVLVARTSNIIQAPMTGGLIDTASATSELEYYFRIIIAASSIGTLIGIALFPTFVQITTRVISHLEVAGSIPNLMKSPATIGKLRQLKYHIRMPKWEMISRLRVEGIPKRLLLMNTLVTAIYTIGVLSALYASVLLPELRVTAAMSSGLINGFATVIFTILVDPQIALMTDKALNGQLEKAKMGRVFSWLMFSRLLGTVLAQLLFIPAAYWVAWISPFFA